MVVRVNIDWIKRKDKADLIERYVAIEVDGDVRGKLGGICYFSIRNKSRNKIKG